MPASADMRPYQNARVTAGFIGFVGDNGTGGLAQPCEPANLEEKGCVAGRSYPHALPCCPPFADGRLANRHILVSCRCSDPKTPDGNRKSYRRNTMYTR